MNTVFDSQNELIKTVKELIEKIKNLKSENKELKQKVENLIKDNQKSADAILLTSEQKTQIEQLLQETKKVLLEN